MPEDREPTIEVQGEKYYGISGIASYCRDMAFSDRPPYPYVALGIEEHELEWIAAASIGFVALSYAAGYATVTGMVPDLFALTARSKTEMLIIGAYQLSFVVFLIGMFGVGLSVSTKLRWLCALVSGGERE